MVSLPVFTNKYIYSKDFKNSKCLQVWTDRRKEFPFIVLMVSPYFITVIQNKMILLISENTT